MAKSKWNPKESRESKKERSEKQRASSSQQTEAVTQTKANESGDPLLQILLIVCTSLTFGRFLIPAESSEQGGTILFVFFWLIIFSVTCWLGMRTGIDDKKTPAIKFDWIDLSIFLITFLGPLFSWIALSFRGGNLRAASYGLWEWIGTFVTVFVMRRLLQSTRSLLPILLLLGTIVPLSGLGLYQHYVSYPEKRNIVNPIVEKWELLEQEILRSPQRAKPRLLRKQQQLQREMENNGIPIDEKSRAPLIRRLNTSDEPTARFALANTLSGILAVAAILIFSVLFQFVKLVKQEQNAKRMKFIFAIAMLAMILFCLLLTKSRTAWLGTIAGVALLVLSTAVNSARINRQHLLAGLASLGAMLLMIFIAILSGGLDSEIITEAGKSFRYRIEYWISSWKMLQENFLFGAGSGNFRELYLEFKLPESSEVILDPHNLWFDAWSQGGLLSLGGLFLLLFCVLKSALQFCISTKEEQTTEPAQQSGSVEQTEWESQPKLISQPKRDFCFDQLPSWKQIVVCSALMVLFTGLFSSSMILLPFDELIGWGIVIAITSCGWLWIANRLPISSVGFLCAAAALFLHLHGAGGYSMPVVIQLLLILAGASIATKPIYSLPARIIFPVGLGAGIILSGGCWWNAVAPKFAEGIAKSNLHQSRSLNQSLQSLNEWIEQDSINPEPWRLLANLQEQNGIQLHDAKQLQQASDSLSQYIDRTPFNYHGYREQARLLKLRFEWSQEKATLQQAILFQEKAITRYPNDSRLHLELAKLYQTLGDNTKTIVAAKKTIELNEINIKHGHTDRVLSKEEQALLLKLQATKEDQK